ncbi:hypothetical protein [Sandaracinus amylolyticus]|uniref:hypothetical protein n=1 Tax=Sandaracinus amylolyticus TaxID=927083 RepID=UPI001F1D5DAC|nr:hypothetical protein [Sandaracinus amylolyticus]UJR79814.1 Hypothetical protein I5071_18520 [Sandaracinus amylolyticus]
MSWLGDDTPLGWAITLAYAIGAGVTLHAARGVREVGARRFVVLSGLALAALAVNKQLDLQTLVFRAGRSATFTLGLYEQRDRLHVIFPVLVGAVLVVVLVLLAITLRRHVRALATMLVGWALLAAFVVVRVALFSHLVRVLGWTWLESAWPALLELGAITLIAIGARRAR